MGRELVDFEVDDGPVVCDSDGVDDILLLSDCFVDWATHDEDDDRSDRRLFLAADEEACWGLLAVSASRSVADRRTFC